MLAFAKNVNKTSASLTSSLMEVEENVRFLCHHLCLYFLVGRGENLFNYFLVCLQCVKLSKFETERAISFIPPDGEFELMR